MRCHIIYGRSRFKPGEQVCAAVRAPALSLTIILYYTAIYLSI